MKNKKQLGKQSGGSGLFGRMFIDALVGFAAGDHPEDVAMISKARFLMASNFPGFRDAFKQFLSQYKTDIKPGKE